MATQMRKGGKRAAILQDIRPPIWNKCLVFLIFDTSRFTKQASAIPRPLERAVVFRQLPLTSRVYRRSRKIRRFHCCWRSSKLKKKDSGVAGDPASYRRFRLGRTLVSFLKLFHLSLVSATSLMQMMLTAVATQSATPVRALAHSSTQPEAGSFDGSRQTF